MEADPGLRLWELWYQQAFGDKLDVKIGQQSIDQEFMISQYGATFVNAMFGFPALPSYDMPGGGPAYPLSSLGVRLRFKPNSALTGTGLKTLHAASCVAAEPKKGTTMLKAFNISEKGAGSYWLLAILRWVMVLIFISFGIQKFTPQSAHGIATYISNSPFVSWLSIFGIRGEAYLLGVIELTIAVLLAAGAFIPVLSALGSLMGIGTFIITWSFFFTTPGVVKWSISTDPIAWNLAGEFLYKDIALLCVCVVLFLASLPKNWIPLRAN